MTWIILSTIITFIVSSVAGYRRFIHIHQLSVRRLTLIALIAVFFYSTMLFLFKYGWLSEAVAGAITANIYASMTGFFVGSSIDQITLSKEAGDLKYVNRTFLSDYAPALLGIALITFGIYRSALFSDLPVTPIRITSGCSFIAIAVWVFSLRVVPEFRKKGIILIDRIILWDRFLSYSWYSEDVIEIEYEYDDALRSFTTIIPPEDQIKTEEMLKKVLLDKISEEDDQE